MKVGTHSSGYYYKAMAVLAAIVLALSVVGVPEADARKKKPKLNTVTCTADPCTGTPASDLMVTRNAVPGGERVEAGAGNDVYEANDGNENLVDIDTTGNDTYRFAKEDTDDFGSDTIFDDGGSSDIVDLRAADFRPGGNAEIVRADVDFGNPDEDDLLIEIDGQKRVRILDHFGGGKMETIRFANGTLTF